MFQVNNMSTSPRLRSIETAVMTGGEWRPVDQDGCVVRIWQDGSNLGSSWSMPVAFGRAAHMDLISAACWIREQREIVRGLIGEYSGALRAVIPSEPGQWLEIGEAMHVDGVWSADHKGASARIVSAEGSYTAQLACGSYAVVSTWPTLVQAIGWINDECERIMAILQAFAIDSMLVRI